MRKLFIVAIAVASLGAWSLLPAFGAIKTGMQRNAERSVRARHVERTNPNTVKAGSGLRTVPYGTGVYRLVQ